MSDDVPGAAPAACDISPRDIDTCVRVLETLLAQPQLLARLPEAERHQLVIAAGRISRPQRHERTRITKAFRRVRKRDQIESDQNLRQNAQIREARSGSANAAAALLAAGSEASPADAARVLPWADRATTSSAALTLQRARNCYVCKAPFTQLHFFYDSMCPACASLNYQKRFQTAKLDGRVALITGARIKIGYYASLMLLRAGAEVIATTRFPHDAARRYAKEADYSSWCDRLTLYGLDLRHCPSVERFAEHLLKTRPRLDLLLNNAAQTVHRPAGFYRHLRDQEEKPLAALQATERPLLQAHHALCSELTQSRPKPELESAQPATRTGAPTNSQPDPASAAHGAIGIVHSAPLAWTPLDPDVAIDPAHFPRGQFDPDGQQLDLRETNSWRLRADEVDTPELIEVHLVNAIAPFILCSRLKALLLRTPNRDKHIVNVSAMEGCFARNTKTDKHPHTNMAKAALNMLTRTSAQDFVKDGIHMNSVDTGWITDEDPHHHAVRKRTEYDFHPPLDAIDGAARICDPIFSGYQTNEHPSGLFFKDYMPTGW